MYQTEHIATAIRQRNWEQLKLLLNRLSKSEFRKVEQDVREDILPALSNGLFWEAYLHLILYRPQAFLTGILAIRALMERTELDFNCSEAHDVAKALDEQQKLKIANMTLPLLTNERQMGQLFRWLSFDDERNQIAALIRVHSPLSYFMLFKTLKMLDEGRELALRCCRLIARKQDDLSYNMVSILRAYFGLHEVGMQLSLRIEPYELSYLDTSFETFMYALEGKKPTILDK